MKKSKRQNGRLHSSGRKFFLLHQWRRTREGGVVEFEENALCDEVVPLDVPMGIAFDKIGANGVCGILAFLVVVGPFLVDKRFLTPLSPHANPPKT